MMAAVAEPTPTAQAPEAPVLSEKQDLPTEAVECTSPPKEAGIISEKPLSTIDSDSNKQAAPAPVESAPAETAPAETAPAEAPVETAPAPMPADNPVPSGPVKTPFPYPLPHCKPTPRPELTADQRAKYDELLAIVEKWTEIPTKAARNSPKAPMTDHERMWLTKDCLLRYLRAAKWHVNGARDRLLTTLTWRREYGVAGFTADHVEPEQETGKQIILGFDNDGRPCLYMDPSKQNTKESERQIHHLVFWLERCIDLMPPGQETLALLIDYKNSSSSKNPGVSTGRKVLNILQGHYPERLGKALISDLPWYVTTFFKLISPFIDPVTKTKMVFNQPLQEYVPASQLQKNYGGEADFVYDHSVYWPAINALCESRTKEYRERWEKRGKKLADEEWYLKGGDDGESEALKEGMDNLEVKN